MSAQCVTLRSADSLATATVAVGLGFNCFRWESPFAGEAGGPPRELLWAEPGFDEGDRRPSGNGIPLLAPFPGRIAGARFEWDGVTYDLEKTHHEHAIHGFALRAPWRVLDQTADRLTAEFRPSVDAPAALAQWPADHVLRATYTLGATRLDLDFSAENVGDNPIPFGFGTHTYFRLPLADGADPESTLVRAPVDGEWLTEGQIPTGRCVALPADNAVAAGAPLAGRAFDTPYRVASGGTTTELIDPASGRCVRQSFDGSMRCCVIYTPGHREAICLEPYTCVPDPIALTEHGVDAGLVTLVPGAIYRTRVSLEATTASV